ncbi:MAG: pyridoxal-phosphate dependent enzyme [Polyangiaceae bacterium]
MSTYPRVYEDNSRSIGHTPLVRVSRVTKGSGATVLAKIEGRNPAYSVKCRIGAAMVWDAEARGLLGPGKAIVEATSGNTGIALAFAAASRGIECVLTMPETMSVERRKVLVAFGAKLVLTPGPQGMKGAIAKAEEIAAAEPQKYVPMRQFENPANPDIHEKTTGLEIWRTPAATSTSLRRRRRHRRDHHRRQLAIEKTKQKPLHSVAVEPVHSPVITWRARGKSSYAVPHKIQGIGAGFVPKNLDLLVRRSGRAGDQRRSDRHGDASRAKRASSVELPCGAASDCSGVVRQRPGSGPARPSSSSCPMRVSATTGLPSKACSTRSSP